VPALLAAAMGRVEDMRHRSHAARLFKPDGTVPRQGRFDDS